MSVQPILPIAGVPDELIRVLNDRLRGLDTAETAAVATSPASLPNVGTPGRFVTGTTDAQGRVIQRGQLQLSDLPGGGYPTATLAAQKATPSGVDLTLNTGYQDFGGMTITASHTGTHLVVGVVDFVVAPSDTGNDFTAQLVVNGVAQAPLAAFRLSTNTGRATVAQHWLVSVTAGQIVKMQAKKAGGTGISVAGGSHSSLTALWLGS